MDKQFNYKDAFSRNIGWITSTEQKIFRHKKVAIAGLGGVGGSHLLTLTRLGIGKFHIADFDVFDIHNFNRQAGAFMSTVGKTKAGVMASIAKDINPELEITTFDKGINTENIEEFLDGVDLYVDSLDFFAVKARRDIFRACADKSIPAVTAAPLGMSTAFLSFLPGEMTFEQYFQLEGQTEQEQLLRFFVGLAPAGLQGRYLIDPSRINLKEHKGPSTSIGIELCAGIAAAQSLKILLNRGKVIAAPRGIQVDAYTNKVKQTWRPGGNSNPLQKLILMLARRRMLMN